MKFSFENAFGYNLGSTFFSMSALLSKNIQSYNLDLTHRQAKFVLFLGSNEGVNQQKLAQIMRRDKPSITKMVDLLEKKGFVERRQDKEDRRNRLIYLTKQGHSIREKLIPVVQQTMEEATQILSSDEHKQLIELLSRVRGNIDEILDDDTPILEDCE